CRERPSAVVPNLLMQKLLLANLLWMSPAWAWAGLAAVGLPLAAHLLGRRRYRPVSFPAARFVAMAVSQAAAVDRPRHLLLPLLLRAAVAAFMRPVWHPDRALAASPGQGVTRLILVDASASMQATEAGQSAFDRALQKVEALLDGLEPGRDRAMVYWLTDRAE